RRIRHRTGLARERRSLRLRRERGGVHGSVGRTEGEGDHLRAARRRRGGGHPGSLLHRGPRGRLAGHRRARDGARGGVRHGDLGRGGGEDPHRPGRRELHREPQVTSPLRTADPAVFASIGRETERQEYNLELIASENYVSEAVLEAQGSILTNKYAEGYPGKRYYGGCKFVDEIETLAIDRAKQLFGAEAANVQSHSGSQANMAVYFSQLQPGDPILAMNLQHGGHLTH